ncbi:MAG: hypothetical protein ACJAS6_000179 [Rickettsiales bacterium]|jgi:hypothetical protein
MIKIISSYNAPTSETLAGIELCNALNERKLECIFYGLDNWSINKCRTEPLSKFKLRKNDVLIVFGEPILCYGDFFRLNKKFRGFGSEKHKNISRVLKTKIKKFYSKIRGFYYQHVGEVKLIFSSSQAGDFNLEKAAKFYDKIHLTDKDLLVDKVTNYFICPNIDGDKLAITINQNSKRIAGIVGDICKENGILESIIEALKDGFTEVIIYGFMKDPVYFYTKIKPLLKEQNGKIKLAGFVQSYQEIFDVVSDIYFYPNEKLVSNLPNYSKISGLIFHGNKNILSTKYMNNSEISDIWAKELGVL